MQQPKPRPSIDRIEEHKQPVEAESGRTKANAAANLAQPEECIAQASACREKAEADPARYDYRIDEAVTWLNDPSSRAARNPAWKDRSMPGHHFDLTDGIDFLERLGLAASSTLRSMKAPIELALSPWANRTFAGTPRR